MTAACASLAGCGGQPAVRTDPLTAYPPDQYLVAEGVSPVGFAEAEQRARSAVAAQIRSTLTSELVSSSRMSVDDEAARYASETDQLVRQDIAFSRAELIRIDPQSRRQIGQEYLVVAVLSRGEANQALRRDFQAAASALNRAADRALAVPAGDLPGLAAAHGEARRSWDVLLQRALELRAITGRYPAGFSDAEARWEALLDRRADQLGGVRLAFDLLPTALAEDRLDTAYLRQQFLRALSDLGLTVRGQTCDQSDYLLELQPRVHYRGLVGVVCRLEFTGHLRECASGHAWDLHLASPELSGEGSSTLRARNAAVAAVSAEILLPLLVAAMAATLPLQ